MSIWCYGKVLPTKIAVGLKEATSTLLQKGTYVSDTSIKIPFTFFNFRSFQHPQPGLRAINNSVSNLLAEMARSLKSGCIRRCSFSARFRLDAFRYLFEGKGTRSSFGQGKNYEKDDFDQRFFPTNWDKVYDHLGDGCMVQYPIRICSKLKWSPLVYHKDGNGILVPKPRTFTEVIMVHVVKKRC